MVHRWGALLLVLALAVPLAVARPAGAVVDLKFYYPVGVSGPLAKVMDEMVADFNRIHPGIHVTPVFAGGYYETMTKTQTAVLGGTPPDVAVLLSTDLFTLLDLHAIIPLDRFIQEAGGERFRKDFFEAFSLNSRVGDTTYSIPFQRSTIVLYYNQDAFEKAGLPAARPPRTWTELVQDAEKLTVRDAAGNVTRWGVGIPTSGSPTGCSRASSWRLANPGPPTRRGRRSTSTHPRPTGRSTSGSASSSCGSSPAASPSGRRCPRTSRRGALRWRTTRRAASPSSAPTRRSPSGRPSCPPTSSSAPRRAGATSTSSARSPPSASGRPGPSSSG